MSEDTCRRVFRSFKEMSRNKHKKYEHDGLYEMNERSCLENFKTVFGHENAVIRQNFFSVISGGSREKVLGFYDYLEVIAPLINGDDKEQANFIFSLYDSNGDGNLDGDDIVKLLQAVPPSAIITKEITMLQTHHVKSKLTATVANPHY